MAASACNLLWIKPVFFLLNILCVKGARAGLSARSRFECNITSLWLFEGSVKERPCLDEMEFFAY